MNGKSFYLLISILLISKSVSAAAIDGLKNLDYILALVFLGAISLLVLIISTLYRFSRYKRNRVLTFSAFILIFCALGSIAILGFNSIDSGFLATCIGLIIISIVAIVLNYKLK